MSRVRRGALVAVGAVVVALLLGLIGYRAFAPRDSVQLARTPYPPLPQVSAQLYGPLLRTPLLVDGRLRVYGAEREVWADQPATTKSSLTPYWSLRRWPQQLLGVVAVDTTVVSLWSDGQLFATDARTGRTRWHDSISVGDGEKYTGRRTGATTVYSPAHLTTAAGLVIVGGSGARITLAVDPTTGGRRWTAHSCATTLFSTADLVVCPGATAWLAASGAPAPTAVAVPAGAAPFGCAPASAACAGYRSDGQAFLLGTGGAVTQAAALAGAQAWLAGDVVVTGYPDGSVTGSALDDGRQLWRWLPPPTATPTAKPHAHPASTGASTPAQVIAVQPGAVHILTADRSLVTLDPADGRQRSSFSLIPTDTRAFAVGHVYAAGGLVFLERLRPGGQADDIDTAYYFSNPGVLVAGG